MSKLKKNKCICKICHTQFRSKDKFKDLCPEHNNKIELDKWEEKRILDEWKGLLDK